MGLAVLPVTASMAGPVALRCGAAAATAAVSVAALAAAAALPPVINAAWPVCAGIAQLVLAYAAASPGEVLAAAAFTAAVCCRQSVGLPLRLVAAQAPRQASRGVRRGRARRGNTGASATAAAASAAATVPLPEGEPGDLLAGFRTALWEGRPAGGDLEAAAPAPGAVESLLGRPDGGGAPEDWELIVDEANDKIDYTAWRKPWRRGLYLYRTMAVISGASAEMYRSFCLNDDHRPEWDTTLVKHELEELRAGSADRRGPAALGGVGLGGWGAAPAQAPGGGEAADAPGIFRVWSQCNFPGPMAPREYSYHRYVWGRDDGGCWVIHRGDKKAPSRGSGVPVEDMVSCFSIREAPGVKGGVELSTVYFEDPRVLSPHMINVTLKAKLWEIIQKQEAAFRQYCGKYPNGPPEVARPLAASGRAPVGRGGVLGRRLGGGRGLRFGLGRLAAAQARLPAAVRRPRRLARQLLAPLEARGWRWRTLLLLSLNHAVRKAV